MTQIRIMSDLHLEFGPLDIPDIENQESMILVLAGDIGVAKQPFTLRAFLQDMCKRHKAVVYVAGNHESYKTSINRTHDKLNDVKLGSEDFNAIGGNYPLDNLHILENAEVELDDTVFIGATLWTDFDRGNPIVMQMARDSMNDFRIIRCGPKENPHGSKFTPHDAYTINFESSKFIFDRISFHKESDKKVCVVTHHSPCHLSVPDRYKGDALNGCYVSNYGDKIAHEGPNVWIHGHLHNTSDYVVGDTRIVCNPRGYVRIETNDTFDPNKVIEL